MAGPRAFLSYTRKDDEFFGGYISAFRKTLENAVHVVRGEETFSVFQDIEGIVIGENWKKKLAAAIDQASFFVPMLSPLFFNSAPCRSEVELFLEHERKLGRDDLLLPIYFLDSAKLEKDEERMKDPIATSISARQMFDWRENANIPLNMPAARLAILQLAGQISAAIDRLGILAATRGSEPPPALTNHNVLASDPRLDTDVSPNTKREELAPKHVLWVDDQPDNNIWERRALEAYGIRFSLARDTAEAMRALSQTKGFAAVISDMGRPGDKNAGLTLLQELRADSKRSEPFFIYTSASATRRKLSASIPRLDGITADPDELVEMVVSVLR